MVLLGLILAMHSWYLQCLGLRILTQSGIPDIVIYWVSLTYFKGAGLIYYVPLALESVGRRS